MSIFYNNFGSAFTSKQLGSLQRFFGLDKRIEDCEWSEIKDLRTTVEPSETIPTFEQVLRFMTEPGVEHVWLMLDIKVRCAWDPLTPGS